MSLSERGLTSLNNCVSVPRLSSSDFARTREHTHKAFAHQPKQYCWWTIVKWINLKKFLNRSMNWCLVLEETSSQPNFFSFYFAFLFINQLDLIFILWPTNDSNYFFIIFYKFPNAFNSPKYSLTLLRLFRSIIATFHFLNRLRLLQCTGNRAQWQNGQRKRGFKLIALIIQNWMPSLVDIATYALRCKIFN